MADNVKNSPNTVNISEDPVLEAAEPSWCDLYLHQYIKVLILGILLCVIFNHEIISIVRRWVTDPSWSHGFLIPFFSLYFVNQRKKEILSGEYKPNYFGLFFLVFWFLIHVFNYSIPGFRIGYLISVVPIMVLGSVALFIGGWRLLKYCWLPIFYLIFAIPLPKSIYFQLTNPMRVLAASIASIFLDMVPLVDTIREGVTIEIFYNGQRYEPSLNVAEACSGMRLLMAFVALGVAMAYLHKRSVWQRLVLLVSTVPIAVLCNVIRVTATGFIHVFIGPEYTQGFYHDMLGILMLPLAFILYGFIGWFMSNLVVDEKVEAVEEIIVRKKR